MKALIFNSGLGSRMGKYCKDIPKGLLKLYNGETILERQLRILSEFGIRDFIITTGPFPEKIREVAEKFQELRFTFVENTWYRDTNYIVSMDLAAEYLTEDLLLLHGDLVFNKGIVKKLLEDKRPSLCLFHERKELPEKDFKGRFMDGHLREVSISIFEEDCYAFQPLYKLEKAVVAAWKAKVAEFVKAENCKVYAENALNEITKELLDKGIPINGLSYGEDYVEEIDNEEDYLRVSEEIKFYDYREQKIIRTESFAESIKALGREDKVFVVCGRRYAVVLSPLWKDAVFFHDYSPNPKYEEIRAGWEQFEKHKCKWLLSVGGGSAMDTAKAIKMMAALDTPEDLRKGKYGYKNLFHIAVPTTAGTGSESTEIAIFYENGKKYALQHGSLVPNVAILDGKLLGTLPEAHKKATFLDSLCQGIESYWAVGATTESQKYARKCIALNLDYYEEYMQNGGRKEEMMLAANYGGRAINISKTTAAHAMSYRLTGLYGIPHGHAVGLCLVPIWKLLAKKAEEGRTDLKNRLEELATIFGAETIDGSIEKMELILKQLKLTKYELKDSDLEELTLSVDPGRMSNHPAYFSKEEIKNLYKEVKIRA